MIVGIWQYLASQNVQAGLALFGAASSAHSMVGGLRTSRRMEALAKSLEEINVKIDRLSAHCYAAPNSVVVDSAARVAPPPGENAVHHPKEVAPELGRLAKAVGGDVLTSAVIWTPEKFHASLIKNPSDVLMQIRGVHETIVVPGDGNLIPVLFESPQGHCVGWQKRVVLEEVYGLRIDELQWKSVVPVASPTAHAMPHANPKIRPGTRYVTRCTACRTAFRVVPDQLGVCGGWVRCGHCSEIFDATQSLLKNDFA